MSPLSFSEKAFDYLFLMISIAALTRWRTLFFMKMDKTIFMIVVSSVTEDNRYNETYRRIED
jgi:hypothetical protein